MIAWKINNVPPQPPAAFIETAFSLEECERIKKLGESLSITKAKIGNSNQIDTDIRTTDISWIEPSGQEATWLFTHMTDLIHYANKSWFRYDLTGPENLQYTIYNVGGFYSEHVDTRYNDQYCRKLSFTLQLSNSDEYEGGEVEIHNGKEPILLKKEVGSMCFFPSYMVHEVKPVTRGTRKALVGWVHGPQWR